VATPVRCPAPCNPDARHLRLNGNGLPRDSRISSPVIGSQMLPEIIRALFFSFHS
jgi:hypothetical protein